MYGTMEVHKEEKLLYGRDGVADGLSVVEG
jgi:hypothetical protein